MTTEPQAVRLTIPAKPEYIALCRLALAGLPLPDDLEAETLNDLKLAITEACSNSVRHAYGQDDVGVVDVTYEIHPDRVVIEVCDEGAGFAIAERAVTPEDLSESGLGLAIIGALSDEVELGDERRDHGSRLRIVKLLH